MKNQKGAGDDMISAELLKYAPDEIYDNIAAEYNNVLENHKNDIDFGLSILLPTQKPKKKAGPPAHLRPLNLLQLVKKVFSTAALQRIKEKAYNYITINQSAYRDGRSTTDIVFAHRFMIAKTMEYQNETYSITGLDMSSVFDTLIEAG